MSSTEGVAKRAGKGTPSVPAQAAQPQASVASTSATVSAAKSDEPEPVVNSLFDPTGVKTLLIVVALSCIYITGFMSRLFSVIRYESIIHEFDPWYFLFFFNFFYKKSIKVSI